jgi:hypothetical protein
MHYSDNLLVHYTAPTCFDVHIIIRELHICIQCKHITSTQLVQFSLVFYCIYSYMFRPHYLVIFWLCVRRCSYIAPLYYIIYYTYIYVTTIYCHMRSLVSVHCGYKYV